MKSLVFLFSIVVVGLSVYWSSLLPVYPDGVEYKFGRYLNAFSSRLAFELGHFLESCGLVDTEHLIRGMAGVAVRTAKMRVSNKFSVNYEHSLIGNTPILVIRPAEAANSLLPAVVYLHGGGWVYGNPDTHLLITSWLSDKLNMVVISVDYGLSPETPYDLQIEECISVTKHVFDNAHGYGVDSDNILVAGDSAGGNLAAVVSQALVNSPYHLRATVLLSPVLQAVNVSLPSYRRYKKLFQTPIEYYLSARGSVKFDHKVQMAIQHSVHIPKDLLARWNNDYLNVANIENYPSPIEDFSEPDKLSSLSELPDRHTMFSLTNLCLDTKAWPLLSSDDLLKSLPPTFIQACELDCLLDDSLLYAHRLKKVGVPVTLSYLPNALHVEPLVGFFMPEPMPTPARLGLNDIYKFISIITSEKH